MSDLQHPRRSVHIVLSSLVPCISRVRYSVDQIERNGSWGGSKETKRSETEPNVRPGIHFG